MEEWDLWYPQAASTGLPFARGRVKAGAKVLLVHSAPPVLTVTLRNETGQVLAQAQDLKATDETPMTRLTRDGAGFKREDIWPGADDLGRVVLLPGGEAGFLKAWWNAEDRSEWKWEVELYNHR